MQNKCNVSVVIPCYNSLDTIERAVQSVVRQSLLPEEIIIIDDCSSLAGMKELLENIKLQNSRIVKINIEYLKKNNGPGTARNVGIDKATCEYIAFLDSDDVWHPDKLKIQFSYMAAHDDIYFSCHHMKVLIVNEADFFCKDVIITEKSIVPINPTRYLFKHYPKGGTPSVMIKKTDLRFKNEKRYSEDYLLWLEYSFKYSGVLLDVDLAASYKEIYGAGGLSANLYKIEIGELETFSILKEKNIIGNNLYILASIFSIIKFIRRWLICMLR